jgi:hypothetical protein
VAADGAAGGGYFVGGALNARAGLVPMGELELGRAL